MSTRRGFLQTLLALPLAGRALLAATTASKLTSTGCFGSPGGIGIAGPAYSGAAIPVLTTGLIRLANGSTIHMSPQGSLRYIEHPNSRLVGTEVQWDRGTGALLS